MSTSAQRREELTSVFTQARGCTRCAKLASTRTQVVFGAGNADADLMFVGEAPGAKEDEQGVPFVGAAGKLLDELLAGVDLTRADVFVANVLKCLRYATMVQLGDGTWERIGRLVRSRYEGTVMSVDDGGHLVPRKVIGWHASPVGPRSVHRLTYKSAKSAGRGSVSTQLTGDHPVLTERGYVQVQELRGGDRIATGQGLSTLAMDVVCGSVLGDSSLRSQSAILTCSHSEQQSDYAAFKALLLHELDPRISSAQTVAVSGSERTYRVVQTRTRAHRALHVLRREFYDERKVVPGWIAYKLTPRMLAFWFMDDGHTRRRPPRQPSSEIATNGFSDRDRRILLEGLMRLGLRATAMRGRLHFDVQATRRLSASIARFVPPSMRYKLHPEVEATIPFDPEALTRGDRVVLYDEVEVENVTHLKRADTTFFCIDVEGTHNFVTAGGVVHNCRPPGNRDPLPAEIDNCQDYLRRQVQLIQPGVICTLGNFSTKLLRGDPTGISRLHGQAEIITIGDRAVRLYPLYHPAAALYTRALLDTLRADVARLPSLLAMDPPAQPEPAVDVAAVPEPTAGSPLESSPPSWAAPADDDSDERQLGLF
ncbi:MAG: uracil-DNA glycosylase family protein [Solirubrobacteraceae bacterium]